MLSKKKKTWFKVVSPLKYKFIFRIKSPPQREN